MSINVSEINVGNRAREFAKEGRATAQKRKGIIFEISGTAGFGHTLLGTLFEQFSRVLRG